MVAFEAQLRVLLVVDRLVLGGPGRLIVSLAAGLRGRGVDVRVAHLGLGNAQPLATELHAANVPVLDLALGSLLDPRPVFRLATYLRREGVDVVHTHNRYAHLVGRAAATLHGRPVVSTVHNIVEDDPGWNGAARRWLDHLSARALCDRVITVAEAQRGPYLQAARVPATRLETHLNGVDTDVFRPDPIARRRVRATLGVATDAPLFVSVAMLRPGKGVRYLLEAVALMRQAAPRLRVAIVGDGAERADLEAMARRLGVDDVVSFLGTRSDIPQVLAAADVYVHPSLFEALPTSILEAMAVGLPVVATSVGGVPEMVAHDRTGLLVPPADAGELAAAMAWLLDPRARSALGTTGRVWVREHASTRVWIDGLLSLYRCVVCERRGRQRLPMLPHHAKVHIR